jgi:Lrp/AsnC family transcriptional regulator for asnA, asnC and gidA
MSSKIDIDRIDDQIMHLLLKDARLTLKEIAKECGVSTVSILNRVNRLKKLGIITGATLFAPLELYDFEVIAFIGMETENYADVNKILIYLKEHTFLVEPSLSIGKYDLHALIYAKDNNDLNERVAVLRSLNGIRKVAVYIWSGIPPMSYDNLDLVPKKR